MYVQFKPFYARYWAVDPSTIFKVRDFSRSRLSAYVINGPRIELVPVTVLDFVKV